MQRRIVAALIVESEAGPSGGVVVESPGGLSLAEGRWRLRMRFAPQTTLPSTLAGLGMMRVNRRRRCSSPGGSITP